MQTTMDPRMLSVEFKPTNTTPTTATKKHKNKYKKKQQLKVVYISSPMKVKTSASNFRALVQELTGRDSDISRYDASYFASDATTDGGSSVDGNKSVESSDMDPQSSDSFLDDVFRFDELDGMFQSCFQ